MKVILVLEVELESPVHFLQEKAAGRIRTIQGVKQVNTLATGERQYDIMETTGTPKQQAGDSRFISEYSIKDSG